MMSMFEKATIVGLCGAVFALYFVMCEVDEDLQKLKQELNAMKPPTSLFPRSQ